MSGPLKYLVIKNTIKEQLLSGVLKYGDKVPSEAELCEQYDVSRISAKRALDELAYEGYIVRQRGRGSFVSYAPIEHLIDGIYSLKDDSLKPATLQMSDTQEPIRLLGESRDMYYVIYDQVGEVKKTWAGTDQYEASSYAYGLIKKKDYWNNKADYIPVDVIVKGE